MNENGNNGFKKPALTLWSTIFTFSASLLLLQGAAHASTPNDVAATNHKAVVSGNNQDNNTNNTDTSKNIVLNQNSSAAANDSSTVSSASTAQIVVQVPTSNVVSSSTTVQSAATSSSGSVASSATTTTNTLNVANVQPTYTAANLKVNLATSSTSNDDGLRNLDSSQRAFLDSIKSGAMDGWRNYGVLPSLTAAQAILESSWGRSGLATEGHNLFGIKGSYNGQSIYMMTREVYGGQSVYVNAAFRRYANNSESVADHSQFLASNSRYHNLLWKTDYNDVTYLIRADGYATDPNYTYALRNLIQRYNLNAWDAEAMNTNLGNLDQMYAGTDGQIHIAGWHASNKYDTKMHHFIIVLDKTTGQEVYRQEVQGTYRQDVQNAYPNSKISGWGGFSLTMPYNSSLAGHSLQVVSRYTYNTNGEANGGDDYFYDPVSMNTNVAHLDNFKIDGSKIDVSGWNANDMTIKDSHHYIILYDKTTNREVARHEVTNNDSADVARVHGDVYGADHSRFTTIFDYTPAIAGHDLQIISRYTTSNDGNSDYSDYWFDPQSFNANDAYLDNFKINAADGKFEVSGWNANDMSIKYQHHFIILYDETTGREITRKEVKNTASQDVTNGGFSGDYGSGNSRFSTEFSYNPSIAGHKLAIVSRYSDENNGEGNHSDYWFAPKTITFANDACLDNFKLSNGKVYASGWNANDLSAQYKKHYLILYDGTTHREVSRQVVDNQASQDVYNNGYSNVYGAKDSRFQASFDYNPALAGHNLQIISRYTNSDDGNSNYSDYWFTPQKFNFVNAGHLDEFSEKGDMINVTGWNANDFSANYTKHYVILYDATTGKEVARKLVPTFSSNDVYNAGYQNVYNSDKSRFTTSFTIPAKLKGHSLRIISRYTSSNDGNSHYSDLWFAPKIFR